MLRGDPIKLTHGEEEGTLEVVEVKALTRKEATLNPRLSDYTRNRAHAIATQNLRRSGASGAHASGPKRQRNRNAAKKAAIRYSAAAA